MAKNSLPIGYYLRPGNLTDAPAINALIRAYDLQMSGEAHHTEVELLQEWQRPDFHLDQDARVVATLLKKSKNEIIIGYQEIWNRSEHAILSGDGYVHPGYNGMGIGTTMLRWLEQRAQQHIPLAPPERRVVIRNGVDGIDLAACELHENEGYQPARYFWHMEIRLPQAPDLTATPPGIRLQTFTPELDEHMVFDSMNEAFKNQWGYVPWDFEEWRTRMFSDVNFDPALWILAIADTQIAGAALCRKLDNDIGWVSQLGVRPTWRRQGLGQALLLTAFQAFYQAETRTVRLSVDAQNPTGATRLYEKAGMHIAHRFIVYEKEIRPGSE